MIIANMMIGLFLASLLTVSTSLIATNSISITNCSCSPLIYKWRLDLSQKCEKDRININVGYGTGIKSATCEVDVPIGSNATDLTPETVLSSQIIELGSDLLPVKIESLKNH